ncbi:glycosyltransferase family 2 protein [Nocardioides sp. Kera G14]|uniref:glycosyltransferase family 2 protein n=1 Tax=Nocardioides sp. Kera G14 TaxID=2884264 RepID=UPI001D1150D8|nr:glycosyltransferase family 2 protein [Nocardioides sp. Kera G14]UDY23112.1 glycosyltransferase family 2 protein [Nocardioides sp. Kera G14]
MPRLTVGLITYNGAAHIRRAVDSILAQTFTDLELLIFDNASTDGTSEICEEYASADPRVRHVRHPETIPQSANFRGVLLAAETELFMWATDDDVRGPSFAADCIEALDAHPDAALACTEAEFLSPDGSRERARGTFTITGTPTDRVRAYFLNPRDSCRLFGVYRTERLKRAYPADVNVFGYDWLVVGLAMLEGDSIEVPSVELVRTANPPGKYFERYDRHFVREPGLIGRASYLLPLLPLTRALKTYLPRRAWRAVRWRLLRLNLHQSLMLVRWKYPRSGGAFNAVRRIDRALRRKDRGRHDA